MPAHSAAPTPTPAPPATPTPTATPTQNPLACAAPPPDPNTGTVTLTGAAQTVTVPCFGTFTSTATLSTNDGRGVTVAFKTSTDVNPGAATIPGDGTPILFTSLTPSAAITFTSTTATIPTAVTSATIAAGHTYAAQAYVPAIGSTIQNVTGIVPVGHTVTFPLNTIGGRFSAVQVIVVLYQTT